jgi:hypothetical protein
VTSLYTRAVEVGDRPVEADVLARGTWGADDRARRLLSRKKGLPTQSTA